MKRRVYIETSVVSYLASRPSRDLVVAGRHLFTSGPYDVPILYTPDELMEDAEA